MWVGVLVLYAVGPIHYNEAPQLTTWFFVLASVSAFAIGGLLATSRGRVGRVVSAGFAEAVTRRRIDRVVLIAAILGLFGAACIALDKLLLSGLDFSQGIAAIRFERVEATEAGTAASLRRSPLLYLGYLTFAFSVVAFLLYMLRGEELRRRTIWLAFLSLVGIFAYSYLYGGRTPLGLAVGMGFGAIGVRLLSRQAPLPRGLTGRFLFAGFLVLTAVYSEAVLADRLMTSGAVDYASLETRLETNNDAKIAPIPGFGTGKAEATSSAGSSEQTPGVSASSSELFLMRVVVNLHYFTHEVPTLDRALAHNGSLGPYYGAYQFNLIPALVTRIVPGWNLDRFMIPELQAANVYGYWPTAWGGMYLDFGVVGALIATFVCGWLAGVVYSRALRGNDDRARLLMCYVVAGIIATPLLPIFAISISLPILLSLVVTALFLGPGRDRAVTRVAATVPTRERIQVG